MTNPYPESSPTPSHFPKPCMRKHHFQNKNLLFSKIYYRSVGKNMELPSEANVLENLPNNTWAPLTCNCRTISQHHSTKNHPVKFLSQPCSFFRKTHVMYSHLIPRLPGAYEMHYAISTQYIQHMLIYKTCIYINIIKHIKHVMHIHHQLNKKLAHMG